MTQTEIKSDVKKTTSTVKPSARYLRDKDRELVKGIFRFHEVPGGTLSFSIKIHKDDKVENYTLVDGEIYTLPLGVAKHLNKNCWYPMYGHLQGGESGVQTGLPSALYGSSGQNMKITQKIKRCSFQSLEFVDIEDISPVGSIITAEAM